MKLQSLTLRNFKGIAQFAIEPQGQDLAIAGDNGTGKTSIFDAYSWLLFDKDSTNRKEFEIKTLEASGEAKHHLEHEVTAVFLTEDGKTVELRKVYAEDWKKKRGSGEATFSGHEITYFWNTVPTPKGMFVSKLTELAGNEARLRLLSDPSHFCQNLHWQDRRKLLIEICGDVTDEDVIASDDALAGLPTILGQHTVDEKKRIIAQARPKINAEIEQIGPRIDELLRQVPAEIPATVDLEPLKTRLRELQEKRAEIRNGGASAEAMTLLRTLEGELQEIKNRLTFASTKDHEMTLALVRSANTDVEKCETELRIIQRDITNLNDDKTRAEERLERLRQEWKTENAKTFTFAGEEVCAACGQSLPADRVAEVRKEAEAQFNERKANALAENQNQGKSCKADIDSILRKREDKLRLEGHAKERLESLKATRDKLQAEADALDTKPVDFETNAEYQAKQAEIVEAKKRLDEARSGSLAALTEIDNEVEKAQTALDQATASNSVASKKAEVENRIGELEKEQKRLSSEIEELEKQTSLIERFIRAKVSMLTTKINSRFQIAQFKLFEEQINGGLSEVCEATVDGVPYDDLNHGRKVNVGIDIINTFADYYKFAPPVFIDNAESVTTILPSLGQQIKLIVSAAHDRLTVLSNAPQEKAS